MNMTNAGCLSCCCCVLFAPVIIGLIIALYPSPKLIKVAPHTPFALYRPDLRQCAALDSEDYVALKDCNHNSSRISWIFVDGAIQNVNLPGKCLSDNADQLQMTPCISPSGAAPQTWLVNDFDIVTNSTPQQSSCVWFEPEQRGLAYACSSKITLNQVMEVRQCSGNGICRGRGVAVTGECKCKCEKPWTGPFCEDLDPSSAGKLTCAERQAAGPSPEFTFLHLGMKIRMEVKAWVLNTSLMNFVAVLLAILLPLPVMLYCVISRCREQVQTLISYSQSATVANLMLAVGIGEGEAGQRQQNHVERHAFLYVSFVVWPLFLLAIFFCAFIPLWGLLMSSLLATNWIYYLAWYPYYATARKHYWPHADRAIVFCVGDIAFCGWALLPNLIQRGLDVRDIAAAFRMAKPDLLATFQINDFKFAARMPWAGNPDLRKSLEKRFGVRFVFDDIRLTNAGKNILVEIANLFSFVGVVFSALRHGFFRSIAAGYLFWIQAIEILILSSILHCGCFTNSVTVPDAPVEATHTFNGEMGVVCSDDGVVLEVIFNKPAGAEGIKAGHKIVNVGTDAFSQEKLKDAQKSRSNYNVTVRAYFDQYDRMVGKEEDAYYFEYDLKHEPEATPRDSSQEQSDLVKKPWKEKKKMYTANVERRMQAILNADLLFLLILDIPQTVYLIWLIMEDGHANQYEVYALAAALCSVLLESAKSRHGNVRDAVQAIQQADAIEL